MNLVGQHILVWVLGEVGGGVFPASPLTLLRPQWVTPGPRGASPLATAQHPLTDLTSLTNDLSASNLEVAVRLVLSSPVSKSSNRLSVPGLCCLLN